MLITANLNFRTRTWEAYRAMVLVPMLAKMQLREQGYAAGAPLAAYANEGRWLVKCDACGGIEFAWEEGWFMCHSCLNASSGHKYRPSAFPAQRAEIEELLSMRPLINRNWTPAETLETLRSENAAHKAELLEVV